jgi:hypothetical protein
MLGWCQTLPPFLNLWPRLRTPLPLWESNTLVRATVGVVGRQFVGFQYCSHKVRGVESRDPILLVFSMLAEHQPSSIHFCGPQIVQLPIFGNVFPSLVCEMHGHVLFVFADVRVNLVGTTRTGSRRPQWCP